MSYCKKEGKDIIMFITEEDHKAPSKYTLPDETESEPGLILPNGDINWNCPCLGGMSSGPCGYEFRSAFSCFHYSKEEPKGSECFDEFRRMTECMAQYPKLYDADSDDPVDLAAIEDEESKGGKAELGLDTNKSSDTAPTDSNSKRPS